MRTWVWCLLLIGCLPPDDTDTTSAHKMRTTAPPPLNLVATCESLCRTREQVGVLERRLATLHLPPELRFQHDMLELEAEWLESRGLVDGGR